MPESEYSWLPYFMATQPRALSSDEYELVDKLLDLSGKQFRDQLSGLVVVGRCGCAMCPTVFFQPYTSGNNELEVSQITGRDFRNEFACAVLIQDNGILTQLEVHSLDGHQSFGLPILNVLECREIGHKPLWENRNKKTAAAGFSV